MNRLPTELQNRIDRELRPEESLAWAGQPVPGRFARPSLYLVPFGIVFTAFALYWISATLRITSSPFGGFRGIGQIFPLFGMVFVLFGLGMVASPWLLRRRAKRTVYALTDQRAILWNMGWTGTMEVRSFALEGLDDLVRRVHGDGSGDLIFEEAVTTAGHGSQGARTVRPARGFIAIRDVREVETLIQQGREALAERD